MKQPGLLLLLLWLPATALAQTEAPGSAASQPSSQPTSAPASQPAAPSSAQKAAAQEKRVEDLQAEIERLKQQLKESSAENEEATDRLEELEALVESISAHVAGIDETIARGGAPSADPGASPSAKDGGARLTGTTSGSDWTWRVGKSSTSLGGYVSWKYARTLDKDPATISFFDVPRFVLFLHSTISERVSFLTEIEIEHVGVNTNDNFRFQGEVVLEFAAMDLKLSDALSLRTGVILVPMGKLNLVHDEPIQDFSERPLVDTFLLPSTWFEPGVGFHGQVALTEDALLRYEAYAIQGITDRITAGGGLRGARAPLSFDLNENKGIVGRVALEPFLGLEIGLSGYAGYYDSENKRGIGIMALDATWRKGPLEVVGEAVQIMLEQGFNNNGERVPSSMRGVWVEGHYHLYADALRVYKGLRNPHFTLMGRVDYVDTDSSQTTEDRLRLSGGVNFRPVEDFVLKLEYHRDLEGFAERKVDDLLVFSTALSF